MHIRNIRINEVTSSDYIFGIFHLNIAETISMHLCECTVLAYGMKLRSILVGDAATPSALLILSKV